MREIKKHYKFSFSKGDIKYYEAYDGDLIAYIAGHINKLNTYSVDKNLNLIKSLYLDRRIAYVSGNSSNICVIKEREKWKK